MLCCSCPASGSTAFAPTWARFWRTRRTCRRASPGRHPQTPRPGAPARPFVEEGQNEVGRADPGPAACLRSGRQAGPADPETRRHLRRSWAPRRGPCQPCRRPPALSDRRQFRLRRRNHRDAAAIARGRDHRRRGPRSPARAARCLTRRPRARAARSGRLHLRFRMARNPALGRTHVIHSWRPRRPAPRRQDDPAQPSPRAVRRFGGAAALTLENHRPGAPPQRTHSAIRNEPVAASPPLQVQTEPSVWTPARDFRNFSGESPWTRLNTREKW